MQDMEDMHTAPRPPEPTAETVAKQLREMMEDRLGRTIRDHLSRSLFSNNAEGHPLLAVDDGTRRVELIMAHVARDQMRGILDITEVKFNPMKSYMIKPVGSTLCDERVEYVLMYKLRDWMRDEKRRAFIRVYVDEHDEYWMQYIMLFSLMDEPKTNWKVFGIPRAKQILTPAPGLMMQL